MRKFPPRRCLDETLLERKPLVYFDDVTMKDSTKLFYETADEAVAYMFYRCFISVFFLFFFRPPKI